MAGRSGEGPLAHSFRRPDKGPASLRPRGSQPMAIAPARLASLPFLFLVAMPIEAQEPDPSVARMIELARKEPRVQEHLRYLTERIGPRLTGSPNLTRACQWARARFETFGLRAWLE